MRYGHIDGIDKDVSRIGLGLMLLARGELEDDFALLDAAWASGVTLFDSAYIYGGGRPDRMFGRWLKARGLAEGVVLLDKCCHHRAGEPMVRPEVITAELNECLQRLGLPAIDILVFHRDDPAQPVGPLVERMNRHIDEGKIRAYGASNWTHERVAEANAYADAHGLRPMAVVSNQYSLAEWIEPPWTGGCVSLTGPDGADGRAYYASTPMALINWSSLCGGFFAGRFSRDNLDGFTDEDDRRCVRCYANEANFTRLDRAAQLGRRHGATPAQIALAWQLNGPLNAYPLTSALTPDQARENAAAADIPLSADEVAYLNLEA
ncbi:MAG: aldo/keto reductase [Planctomycetota bacterium]